MTLRLPFKTCLRGLTTSTAATLALFLLSCSSGGDSSRGATTSSSPRVSSPSSGSTPSYSRSSHDPYYISPTPRPGSSSAPSIRAASYLLIDGRTGAHLASRIPTNKRAVASTQKLVTALVVIDAGDLDRRITIAGTDTAVEPSRLGIGTGQSYTRRDLLYAFLIKSSNDVAKALARDNAGSSANFALKMNAKMRQLGAMDSNFKNPHGLTESGQYSTASDMARVGMASFRNPVIRDAVRRKYYNFRFNSGRTVTLKNTNNLLGVMTECNGMKTGYTRASGRTLISSASSGGRDVILVQLGSKTSYIFDDARKLMAWGLRRLGARGVAQTGDGELMTLEDPQLAALISPQTGE